MKREVFADSFHSSLLSFSAEREGLAVDEGAAALARDDAAAQAIAVVHEQAGDAVEAEVQQRRDERHRGARQDREGVFAEREQVRQGLVHETAARDDDEIARRQDPVAGGVGEVALLRRALEHVDGLRLLAHARRAVHVADQRDGPAALKKMYLVLAMMKMKVNYRNIIITNLLQSHVL